MSSRAASSATDRCAEPGRGQLEGERDAVQAAADQRDRFGCGRVEGEAGPRGAGPLDEQLDGLELCEPGRIGVPSRRGSCSDGTRQVSSPGTRSGSRPVASTVTPGQPASNAAASAAAAAHQVLAVVQHQEHALGAQPVDDRRDPRPAARQPQPDRRRDSDDHLLARPQVGQLDEPHPVRIAPVLARGAGRARSPAGSSRRRRAR